MKRGGEENDASVAKRLNAGQQEKLIPVPADVARHLLKTANHQLLVELSGAEVFIEHGETKYSRVTLLGSPEQIQRATKLIARVTTHCQWGCNEDKVARILKPQHMDTVMCRLSPMHTLKPAEKVLNSINPTLSIGKGKDNDVVITESVVSRSHCVLQFDPTKSAIYVVDYSTNGTYLNGLKLPAAKLGKVVLSHGDELLLKDPATGDQEFGYVINLMDLSRRDEDSVMRFTNRLMSPSEKAAMYQSGGRDVSAYS